MVLESVRLSVFDQMLKYGLCVISGVAGARCWARAKEGSRRSARNSFNFIETSGCKPLQLTPYLRGRSLEMVQKYYSTAGGRLAAAIGGTAVSDLIGGVMAAISRIFPARLRCLLTKASMTCAAS